jgi:hypothetical protein
VRYVQGILVIIGSTALSTVLGVLAIAALVGLFQRPGGEPWTRGFGQYIGGLVCGALLGALVGFVGSLGFIRAQDDNGPWHPIAWIGIALGLVAGTALSFHWGMASGNQWELVVALVAFASGTAGGIFARLVLAVFRSAINVRRG